MPMNEIVTDLDDLDSVKWKISASDVGDITAGAGFRIMKGRANQDDRDQMRQYKNHHMCSLMTSEPPSPLNPLSERAFPKGNGSASKNDLPPIELRSPTHDGPT